MRISYWSSDVCSSDVLAVAFGVVHRRGVVAGLGLLAAVEAGPHRVPVAARRALAVLGRARFEEVGVLDAVEQRGEPGEGVFVDHVDRLEPKLPEAPVGDVAGVGAELRGATGK